MARLFTQAELNTMCLTGTERVAAALDSGKKAYAKEVYADVEKAFREFHDIYTKQIQAFIDAWDHALHLHQVQPAL
jgi:hypothetical protein